MLYNSVSTGLLRYWIFIPVTKVIDTPHQIRCASTYCRFHVGWNEKDRETDTIDFGLVRVRRVKDSLVVTRKLTLFKRQVNGVIITHSMDHLSAGKQIIFRESFFVRIGFPAM